MENRLGVARDSEEGGSRKWVLLEKGNMKDLCGDGNILFPDCIHLHIPDCDIIL